MIAISGGNGIELTSASDVVVENNVLLGNAVAFFDVSSSIVTVSADYCDPNDLCGTCSCISAGYCFMPQTPFSMPQVVG